MLHLGADDAVINEAEKKLGVTFPAALREFYRLSNGIEIAPDWQVCAVFDPSNPRKSANHIVHENTAGRWSYMPLDLICLAGNGTGNQLVLQKGGEALESQIYVWDHEANKLRKWSKGLEYLITAAHRRVDKIEKLIQKGKRRTGHHARPDGKPVLDVGNEGIAQVPPSGDDCQS